MKIRILGGIVFAFCLLLALPGFAGKEFEWEPLTETDWQAGEDTAYAGYPAIMLFEKIEADEQKLLDDKCYFTVYRRIKILNSDLDINYVFLSMMELLGKNCGLAFVTDRDEGLFLKEAKYWQFDRVFVVEPRLGGNFWFYSPGDLFLPIKRTPWINEGMLGFVIVNRSMLYPTVPFSSAYSNQSCRCLSLNFTDDGKFKLNVRVKLSRFLSAGDFA